MYARNFEELADFHRLPGFLTGQNSLIGFVKWIVGDGTCMYTGPHTPAAPV